MPCTPFNDGQGSRGFICTMGPRFRRCSCGSGKLATQLCDWKVPTRSTGTCDAKLCPGCTHKPALGKDLCPNHAREWKARSQ